MNTPWTATSASNHDHGSGAGQLTLVSGNTFLVGSVDGDLGGDGVEGLYMLDTRVLSHWRLLIDGERVDPVTAMGGGPFSVSIVGRAAPQPPLESDLAVLRRRHIGQGMREDIELIYYGPHQRDLVLGLEVGSDFASLFDVKGGHRAEPRQASGRLDGRSLFIGEQDSSGPPSVVVQFDVAPDGLKQIGEENRFFVWWHRVIEPRSRFSLCVEAAITVGGRTLEPLHRCGQPVEQVQAVGQLSSWLGSVPTITSDSPVLVQAAQQAVEDLGSLRIVDTERPDRVVVAAGAPWFMTLFGRDALITAHMALLVDDQMAHGVLHELADAQGVAHHAETEEQPGRILHEVRYDYRTSRLLGGRNIYYGTADATPLFVMLVAELARWTGQPDRVVDLMPAVDRAMNWIAEWGDKDGDGFVEYERGVETGLANQGWKDSWDGVRYQDGTVAEAPIALAEVQGYVYAAYKGRADLADLFGDPVAAGHWRKKAADLQIAFEKAFWIEERGWYATALDRNKTPVDSLASNLGHCLWTKIVSAERAVEVANWLGADEMFSGWGLRTLASNSHGFNPLSYHCGSVWPHDTAIAVAGLARYGHHGAAQRLSGGLFDVAATCGRLPELFAGFERGELAMPVPYPASCSPQAWAAASPLLLIRSILGFEPDLIAGEIRLRPRLPDGVNELKIDGIMLGDQQISVHVTTQGTKVEGLGAGIRLQID